jgi:hypothetical protein
VIYSASMILIKQIDGRSCPLIICDACNEPITNIKMGIVRYKSGGGDGDISEVQHSHKTTCDKALSGVEGKHSWQDLSHHLFLLLTNSGMPSSEIAAEVEGWEKFQSMMP